MVGGAVLVCASEGVLGCWVDWACDGAVEGGEAWFDWVCELLAPVFGLDWLVVVEVLSEDVDGAFWADGAEL